MQELSAYCVKCREKRAIDRAQPVFTSAGAPATRGVCPVCGAAVFRMGKTEAHDALDPPVATRRAPAATSSGQARRGRLVIVESPAKARSLKGFLGKGYRVEASMGHVRDLLRSKLSIDVENGFQPTYRVPNEKRKVVKRLKSAAAEAAEVFLATDPDREGESIAWHLLAAAEIPDTLTQRVAFHEITAAAIQEAFAHPRALDLDLVNAQQARRVLDRLVGYKISPLLWKKVRNRLSAGRVQSVAVRLVVEREREIEAFVPVEYWSISAELAKVASRGTVPRPTFVAKLHAINGKQADLRDEPAAQTVVDDLEHATYVVGDVRKSKRTRKPLAPFITSTLQQQASSMLGFAPRRTMALAQQLYEGVDLGNGESVGLITYMRTDSTHVADEALAQVRSYIERQFGPEMLPTHPARYKTRVAKAQEAHECIRPTSVRREPDALRALLDPSQFRLYRLIWQRFVASQMKPAVYNTTSVDVHAGHLDRHGPSSDGRVPRSAVRALPYLFRGTSSTLAFPGFLLVYAEEEGEKQETAALPPLTICEVLDLVQLIPEQHFTQPPPRFTEATLIRELESHGIGRPSTYAPIISTIQSRGYVVHEKKQLRPAELGFVVNDILVEHFPDIVDISFTAHLEEDLDMIAEGEREWVSVLHDFYGPFAERLELARVQMKEVELPSEDTGLLCEKCGHPMVIKFGRYGKFVACGNFPNCRNTKSFAISIGVACPRCEADLVEKRSRRGRTFYGCSQYPTCDFVVWKRPSSVRCPSCGGFMTESGKNQLTCTECQHSIPREEHPESSS